MRVADRVLAAVAALLVAPLPAHGREALGPLTKAGDQAVWLTAGMDRAPAAGLGYARSLAVPALPRRVTVVGDVTAPVRISPASSWRLEVAGRVLLPSDAASGWTAWNRLMLRVTRAETYVHSAVGLAVGDAVLAGFVGDSWFAAAELGYTWFAATHLTHTDEYRALFGGVKDGWYRSTGGAASAGLQAGVTLFGLIDVSARTVAERTGSLGAPIGVPVTATLSVGARF